MKLLLVICALVACTSAATVYKMKSHLEVTKEIISSSVDDPMDILESVEIEQLTSNDQDQDQESYLSKKRPVALCRLCHEVVGFVIHTTHNRTSKVCISLVSYQNLIT